MSCKIRRIKKNTNKVEAVDESLNSSLIRFMHSTVIPHFRSACHKCFTKYQNIHINIPEINDVDILELLGRPATGHILEAFVTTLVTKYKNIFQIADIDHNSQTDTYDITINPKICPDEQTVKITLEIKAFKDGKISNPKITEDQKLLNGPNVYYMLIDYTANKDCIHINCVFLVNGNDFTITPGNRIAASNINKLTDHQIF